VGHRPPFYAWESCCRGRRTGPATCRALDVAAAPGPMRRRAVPPQIGREALATVAPRFLSGNFFVGIRGPPSGGPRSHPSGGASCRAGGLIRRRSPFYAWESCCGTADWLALDSIVSHGVRLRDVSRHDAPVWNAPCRSARRLRPLFGNVPGCGKPGRRGVGCQARKMREKKPRFFASICAASSRIALLNTSNGSSFLVASGSIG
jgi:hypothetical protein